MPPAGAETGFAGVSGGWPRPVARLTGMRITVPAGGVGAARFLRGLKAEVPGAEITVIGNTGDDITLHGLRHTNISISVKASVHPKVIAERAGHHSSSYTLDTYAHLSVEGQRGAASAIATSSSRQSPSHTSPLVFESPLVLSLSKDGLMVRRTHHERTPSPHILSNLG